MISVVTPAFNSQRTIRETLESVARQDYPHVEHIVMDGGSTDGTQTIVRQFPKVRLISDPDEGHYHAMNKGIALAAGDVVIILNADDCLCDGILAKAAAALALHPEWDAVFGDVIYVDGEGKEIYRREEACWDYQVLRFGFGGLANQQALFVRKTTYERIGAMRHQDFKNCCDFEFLMRLGKTGCNVGHIREYVVRYRYHEYGQSADRRIVANMKRESAQIRAEYGVPGGIWAPLLRQYARIRRQIQKLVWLGRCDLIPGTIHLRRHMRQKSKFSSNIGLDKL